MARTHHTTLSIIEGSKVLVLNLRATLGQCGVLIINHKKTGCSDISCNPRGDQSMEFEGSVVYK